MTKIISYEEIIEVVKGELIVNSDDLVFTALTLHLENIILKMRLGDSREDYLEN